ncbi:hypothetical protein [Pseudomonas phage UF_RH7]|nr:hypothetical protein [Pseudomonas phage UF_RH7]
MALDWVLAALGFETLGGLISYVSIFVAVGFIAGKIFRRK